MVVTRIGVKGQDDIVIVSCVRTAITKAKKGQFKDTKHEYLLSHVLKAVVQKVNLDPAMVQDIVVGNVCPPQSGANLARMAMLHAGFPETSSIMTINRQCSSGLTATMQVASAIRDGTIDIGIGAGCESMTSFQLSRTMTDEQFDQDMQRQPNVADCRIPMGITSENVAHDYGISREKQDRFSAESHRRATYAQQNGYFDAEITPVPTVIIDANGNKKHILVTKDDGIRPTTTVEGLAKLKPVFKEGGSTTAGNSSQVSDGAAAVLLMKRSRANQLGLPILAKIIDYSVVGVPPRVMGIGPAFAIPKVLKKIGIYTSDIDIFEINEAFASQAVYCVEKLGIDPAKVNPKGGAIAFGHPLGCTGARQISTLIYELIRTGKKLGATSMCLGSGMGMCAVFEAEQ
ncbi:3-ketoacyl-CoA thiolase B, peroxisomal [Smittium culicis]|uniref:3-ketoacyl-CoA thiolase B, peroxisomal n=1 Tax=Smittium culicis TaxID=133412 RepID=A0A1R1X2M3_9FUNG|nr:3-ketoacyl-CoA thiolase B, peroxisomal [Smittium culicis]OMJ17421.1 3-ketoacyl-CoA thiolase B, peroxisomal [Smittium culicis]